MGILEAGQGEPMHRKALLVTALAAVALVAGCAPASRGAGGGARQVVVYTSVDQVFAEPVFVPGLSV